ncbi:MAG: hypothetical protein A3F09_06005 [Chlamydiae bacterium RIFCSPHIGHO2_12_FULL_49_11]|nr:MAG: hypothetical protein A3F09_06005 [Chlamydiae bacterium RIFCSPHIGHO2_12_FULL_49_11]
MTGKKKWQSFLIIGAFVLTLYNIFPTLVYYSKPLKKSVSQEMALTVGKEALSRVDSLENDAVSWLKSYCRLLHVKPSSIRVDNDFPEYIDLSFASEADQKSFTRFFPKAGQLIPFFPASLSLAQITEETESAGAFKTVIQRKIPVRFSSAPEPMSYIPIYSSGTFSPEYSAFLKDRILSVVSYLSGPTPAALQVKIVLQEPDMQSRLPYLAEISDRINDYRTVFASFPDVLKEYYSRFFSLIDKDIEKAYNRLVAHFQEASRLLSEELGKETSETVQINRAFITSEKEKFDAATATLKKYKSAFIKPYYPQPQSQQRLYVQGANLSSGSVKISHPLFSSIGIDIRENNIILHVKPVLEKTMRESASAGIMSVIFGELNSLDRVAGESFTYSQNTISTKLLELHNPTGLLLFDLRAVAGPMAEHVKELVQKRFTPKSGNLRAQKESVVSMAEFDKLPELERAFSLIVYAPLMENGTVPLGFKKNAVYVIFKNFAKLESTLQATQNATEMNLIQSDLDALASSLRQYGFTPFKGSLAPIDPAFASDLIFESTDYALPVLQGTRENFVLHAGKEYASLELSDVKERLFTLNRIESAIHEDLLRWRDDYQAAQINPDPLVKFDVPKPTKNPYLQNWSLSWKKILRGDEKKVLAWGMDLSGGKTIQIALRDAGGKRVTNDADIKQAINELFRRVNKMGVSDVNIRREGNLITLDFPGSQNVSARDLVKASSMTFHIVNEKFTAATPETGKETSRFLQDVWNEAKAKNTTDTVSLNQIARSYLYGESVDPLVAKPKTAAAKALVDAGLRIADPLNPERTTDVNTEISQIAVMKGTGFTEWGGQANPLMIVFNNIVLEGSSLSDVHASYDPSKGNYLSFSVKSSSTSQGQKTRPQNEMAAWTSLFSKESLRGNDFSKVTLGRGWRMAVILNGYVISSPVLESPLRDSGMISGHFTQREIQKLVSDLKAGSLTFTPEILSETTVSPDLGSYERTQGMLSTLIAIITTVVIMVACYRFMGLIASLAVLFNLIIIWAALQNMGASLSLAGLAGVILTVGMAVDANVLVFERFKEEYAHSQNLLGSLNVAYRKAFSAIFDSNITTIIAAFILLHFDAGPVKGFAVTLIIGIVSSMFTALFVTKVFFLRFYKNRKDEKVHLPRVFKVTNVPFLKIARPAVLVFLVLTGIGLFSAYRAPQQLLGIDFTGGSALTVTVANPTSGLKETVENALRQTGLQPQDFQVKTLGHSGKIKILLKSRAAPVEMGHDGDVPQIALIKKAFASAHLSIVSAETLESNFTSISGQMSDTMKMNAVYGLIIALVAILIYITIRFEWAFAFAATMGLVFDVICTLSLVALGNALGMPLQIDLNAIAAILTIVGYSLNDTIIVFDRIREDMKHKEKRSVKEIIDLALNETFSRTMLTSLTTLAVLLALVLFGGYSVFNFAFIMTIGVIIGTLSTFMIASLILSLIFKKLPAHQNGDGKIHQLFS